jgi:hypothetical protein
MTQLRVGEPYTPSEEGEVRADYSGAGAVDLLAAVHISPLWGVLLRSRTPHQ